MSSPPENIRLFLCGDVMTGRGVDQIMAHPSDPILYESSVTSALDYMRLAEAAHGAIRRPVSASYVWGVALDELSRRRPLVRLINLETSITRSSHYLPKGINYRMSPENADCLSAAEIDCCALANNHVIDWGRAGLIDTLDRLAQLNIKVAGAGRNMDEAHRPAILDLPDKARVLVFSFASITSGVPRSWAAGPDQSGVNFLPDLTEHSALCVAEAISQFKRPHDIVVVSIHWGSNWGYEIPDDQRAFAHLLIDNAGISILHGHSAHHAKAIEVYRNRLILYGCGDFINDYEGIDSNAEFRDDLALMYFADIDKVSGDLRALEMVPLQIRWFRLQRASHEDVLWLSTILDRESRRFETRVNRKADDIFALSWQAGGNQSEAGILKTRSL